VFCVVGACSDLLAPVASRMSLTMNNFSHHGHAPSPSTHHHSLSHLQHSHHPPDTHQHSSAQGHFSIRAVPEPGRTYPLNAVRHSSRDDLSYTSYSEQPRYPRQLMQPQPERRCQFLSYVCLCMPLCSSNILPCSQLPVSPHDERAPSPASPSASSPCSHA
jgi:hypothetical protein